jgi:hypothetical protein
MIRAATTSDETGRGEGSELGSGRERAAGIDRADGVVGVGDGGLGEKEGRMCSGKHERHASCTETQQAAI